MSEEPSLTPPGKLTFDKPVATSEKTNGGPNHEYSAVSELTPPDSESPISHFAQEQLPPDGEEEGGELQAEKAGDAWVSELAELPGLQPARGGLSGPRIPLVVWIAVLVLTASAGLLWRFRPQPPKAASKVSQAKPAAQNRAEPKPAAAVPEATTTASRPANPPGAAVPEATTIASRPANPPGTAVPEASGTKPAIAPGGASGASGEAAAPVQITGLEHMSHRGTTSVVLHLSGKVEYEDHRLSGPERIYLDIPHTQLTPELTARKPQVNELLVRKIRIAQPSPSVTRLAIETAGYCDYTIEAGADHLSIQVKRQP